MIKTDAADSKERTAGQSDATWIAVSHVADRACCYPGETVSLYARVQVRSGDRSPWPPAQPHKGPWPVAALKGRAKELALQVRVALPAGLILDSYEVLIGPADMPWITVDNGANNLIWRVDLPLHAAATGYALEYRVRAHVAHTREDRALTSRAIVSGEPAGQDPLYIQEAVTVAVAAEGRYLRYLPALYRDDELMGRLLMLFESFYGPIEQQIGGLDLYFDPRFTPPGFLPWLASWLDLVLDERWPEARRRALLRAAAVLYRRRGTRRGLEDYLEIYTGVRPRIVEHRAHNLQLGPEARLGPGVALGRANLPHTFTVTLCLSPEDLRQAGVGETDDELEGRTKKSEEQALKDTEAVVQRIKSIIDAEKPAHTRYTLRLERTAKETRAVGEERA